MPHRSGLFERLRFGAAAFFVSALLLGAPAQAASLLSLTITTALSATPGTVFQFFDQGNPRYLAIQCVFTYGSGGTTADAYVQTSLDGGATWVDIANCHFTTASLKQIFNLSSMTPVTTVYVPTDGSITNSTAKDGILGQHFRVKYVTTGTYAASTTLKVDVISSARFRQ